jgi:peptidyl-tRNA hydrolase
MLVKREVPSYFKNEDGQPHDENEWGEYFKFESALRMYIMVRSDCLPIEYCVPQACHAVAEYMKQCGHQDKTKDWIDNHKTMVVLQGTLEDMNKEMKKCWNRGDACKAFCEPDLDGEMTAVVFEPVTRKDGREYFGEYKLLK